MSLHHLLKQAENFQKSLEQIDKSLEDYRATGTAGGGVVKAVVNGQGVVQELTIDSSLVANADTGVLADAVLAALRQAQEAAHSERQAQRKRLLGDLELPDL
jgi:hypothetical protein